MLSSSALALVPVVQPVLQPREPISNTSNNNSSKNINSNNSVASNSEKSEGLYGFYSVTVAGSGICTH